ncbi:hypothetical protein BJ878DRAFT_305447 [Calycina marina]|uniref:BTB domain-containing protein n=1 Tax=Calycina marina TaxID=1763456 RepID=A0A9P8CB63_9HELO|nr:hypothetical protein BJ878DRAFT_305447 [Calycina marina]
MADADGEGALLPVPRNETITLQVGNRQFTTYAFTLKESGYLKTAITSGKWSPSRINGAFFLDADPEIFSHILQYLQRNIMPLFYDNIKGHDHALYSRVLQEARYLDIPGLAKWLEEKQYLKLVRVRTWTEEKKTTDWTDDGADEIVKVQSKWEVRKAFVCPRGISPHNGHPNACGRQCHNARVNGANMFEDRCTFRTVLVKRKVIVDAQACGMEELAEPKDVVAEEQLVDAHEE